MRTRARREDPEPSEGHITHFCHGCDAVSLTVHSDWEAIERYNWGQDSNEDWYCPECFAERVARHEHK